MTTTYASVADELAGDIAAGRLRAGERLPPHRAFAYSRGIAVSTASRVYAELTRRGLVAGEVGRGTFVRAAPPATLPLADPSPMPVDLELNVPILAEQGEEVARALDGLLSPSQLPGAFAPLGPAGTPEARRVAAGFLARRDFSPDPDAVRFTGNGKQAIAAALSALAAPGERIGVEAITYSLLKGLAARMGIILAPLEVDEHGVRPDALAKAHQSAPLRGVYLQPALHNPLGLTMTEARRQEVGAFLRAADLIAVEDAIYAFLVDEPPLAAAAPGHTILIDSLSKRVAPGLTLGFLVCPPALTARVTAAISRGAWAPAGLPMAAALRLMESGAARRIGAAKRRDAAARQRLAAQVLGGLETQADPRAYHLWLQLPEPWRAESFTAEAARRGIAVAPASAFAVSNGHAPPAVRLALAAPPMPMLEAALRTLRRLALDPGELQVD